MSYINTTTPTRIWIGGKEYTDWMISGSVNDESSLSSAIAKTSGSIKLGGVHNSLITKEFPLPIGSEIIIQCTLPGGFSSRHPRGTLYVINSTINYEDQTVDIEVGCSLFFASTYEVSFRPRIKELFDLIPEPYSVFNVENYDLSELNGVLESLGYIMYQDKNGKIQCAPSFGAQGFGAVSSSSKFTCYDNATAISIQSLSESSALVDPASLVIKMDWGIPLYEPPDPEEVEDTDGDGIPDDEEDEDDDGENENTNEPISETQYLKTKVLTIADIDTCLQVHYGKKIRVTDAKVYNCGVALNPEYIAATEELNEWNKNPDFCKKPLSLDEFFKEAESFYAYEVKGKLATVENYISDEIQKYQYAEYNGPGKQLSYEKTYETMSIWRIADASISQWLDNVSREYDLAIEEANAAMSECNEYAQICEENNIWIKTEAQRNCLTKKEKNIMEQTFAFYDCLFTARLARANELIEYAIGVRNVAINGLSFFYGKNRETNITERFITFGEGGEILSSKETNTIQAGASKFTVDFIKRTGEISSADRPSGVIDDQRTASDVGKYKFGPPLHIITGECFEDLCNWPIDFLQSETIDVYEFYNGVVKQTSTKFDYENPENNTVDIKISTDNSTAAPAEPRNESASSTSDIDGDGIPDEEDPDRDGDGDPNDTDPEPDDPNVNSRNLLASCNINTETVEREYTILGKPVVPMLGAGWAGYYTPAAEEISMPISFKDLVPEDVQYAITGQPVSEGLEELMVTEASCKFITDEFRRVATANMVIYEEYINKYLAVAMAKRLSDNKGIRIVEKMRAEVFDYYPFMPITVVLTANQQTMLAYVSSATWAFDSTNAICSFDCYIMS